MQSPFVVTVVRSRDLDGDSRLFSFQENLSRRVEVSFSQTTRKRKVTLKASRNLYVGRQSAPSAEEIWRAASLG